MKTANIPVYGNIAVYINSCAVCLKIARALRLLNREDTDKCILTITYLKRLDVWLLEMLNEGNNINAIDVGDVSYVTLLGLLDVIVKNLRTKR